MDNKIAILIKTADCVPILLFDEDEQIIAAIHAGWKGAKNGIVQKTILEIQKLNFAVNTLHAIIGPSIQQQSYEVLDDFYQLFTKDTRSNERFFNFKDKKMFFNLPEYISYELQELGVKNIYNSNINTYEHKYFSSFRKNKDLSTTNLSIIIKNTDSYMTKFMKDSVLRHRYEKTSNRSISYELPSKEYITPIAIKEPVIKATYNIVHKHTTTVLPIQIKQKIKSRKLKIDSELDLHGCSVKEAYEMLKDYIIESYNNQLKLLLVITGKNVNNTGLIKSNFTTWIQHSEISQYILYYSPSYIMHGGEGAFYVMLRKKTSYKV